MDKLIARYRKSINPPWNLRDYFNLVFTFTLLLAIPFIPLFLQNQQTIQSQAQTTQATLTASPTSSQAGAAITVSWNGLSNSTQSMPPSTSISNTIQAADGTWCYDFDGSDDVDPQVPYSGIRPNINVGYSTQAFCQDNNGMHGDFCESGTTTARDYYCAGTWDGSKFTTVKCQPGDYTCSPGSNLGDVCTRGACSPGNPPPPVSTSTVPATKTLQGSDGTWCNDSDGNGNLGTKGTCQDSKGIYTDYCNGSDHIQDYYCTGDWKGSSYANVRCETGTHGCTSQLGSIYSCSDGQCIISSTPITPTPATLPSLSPTPTQAPITSPTRRVFVTSTQYQGNLGGLSGADNLCQTRANAANLGGKWKAWLSDTTTSATTRLEHFNGPYVRLDNQVVANSWADLTDGTLQNPINLTENNSIANYWTNVWTGTSPSGNSSSSNCNNWTSNVTSSYGSGGSDSTTLSYWTEGASGPNLCNSNQDLYCFEQPTSVQGVETTAYAQTVDDFTNYRIALYISGASNQNPISWTYLNCTTTIPVNSPQESGTCNFTIPATLSSGTYEFRLFANDQYSSPLAVSNAISITAASTPTPIPFTFSNISASNITATSAKITWTTSAPGTSRVAFGITSKNLNQSTVLNSTLTTAHTMTLTGLSKNKTYYYRVYSNDASGKGYTGPTVNSFKTLAK